MKPKQSFFSSPGSQDLLPELFYDLLLVDGPYPVLFTCVNQDESQTYLVACYQADKECRAWSIVPCPLPRLMALLEDQITLREAFGGKDEELYILKQTQPEKGWNLIRTQIKYGDKALPSAGYYLDPDEGEFAEELELLHKRQRAMETLQDQLKLRQAQLIQRPEQMVSRAVSPLICKDTSPVRKMPKRTEKASLISTPFTLTFAASL